jgi:DNA-binding LytR/AlgR family response regulator
MNIIICDDNEKDRKTLIELLQDYEQNNNQSFNITEYTSGTELCNSIDTVHNCELIFLDINMSDIDGLKTAANIINSYPKIPIVLVTAYMNYALDGYKVKACRFLLKDDLANTINECMDHFCVLDFHETCVNCKIEHNWCVLLTF